MHKDRREDAGPQDDPTGITFDVDPSRLRQPKNAERIADEIRRWIVHRQRPGDRLPTEKELIQLLASSRGTVREALKILEAQGLVQITPGAGGRRPCRADLP